MIRWRRPEPLTWQRGAQWAPAVDVFHHEHGRPVGAMQVHAAAVPVRGEPDDAIAVVLWAAVQHLDRLPTAKLTALFGVAPDPFDRTASVGGLLVYGLPSDPDDGPTLIGLVSAVGREAPALSWSDLFAPPPRPTLGGAGPIELRMRQRHMKPSDLVPPADALRAELARRR